MSSSGTGIATGVRAMTTKTLSHLRSNLTGHGNRGSE